MAVRHFVARAGKNRSQPGRWMLYPRPATVLVAGSLACRMSERGSQATLQALGVDKRCRATWQRYVERHAEQRRRAQELVVEQEGAPSFVAFRAFQKNQVYFYPNDP